MQKEETILPSWKPFLFPVMTPLSTRSMIPSENISVCTPRSFFSSR